MSSVSVWVLTIVGVIFVNVIVEIIMPEGKMNKLIKGLVSIFMVFAMVSPLPFVSLDKIDFGKFFDNNTTQVDDKFVENINLQKIAQYETLIKETLHKNGYKDVSIIITSDYIDYDIKINQVYVDLTNLVLNDKNLNIDKYTNIKKIILGLVEVKEENILFYGG